ncbi:hypothetical protein MHIMP23_05795 [Methylobacterium hispanicum]
MNLALTVVLPLACYSPPPVPAVNAPVMAALMGEPVQPSANADVAAALQALAPLKRRGRR